MTAAASKGGAAATASAATAAATVAACAAVICAVGYRPLCRLLSWMFPAESWGPGKGVELAVQFQWHIMITCLLYLPAVWALRWVMSGRPAYSLRALAFVWNLLLSLLSFLGFMTVLIQQPTLLTVPVHPERLFVPPVRVVVALFTLTKAVEFGDTFILVFKKKPLSFLHVYHHLTVTLYCWSAQRINVDFAHGFVLMNLGVHSLMYLYYCLSCCVSATGPSSGSKGAKEATSSPGTRSSSSSSRSLLQQLLRQSRPAITLMQIAQMIVGMYLATKGALCLHDQQQVLNAQIALAMYTSYAILFLRLYCSSYLPHLSSNRVLLLFLLHALAAAGVYRLSCATHKLHIAAHCAVAAGASLLLAFICSSSSRSNNERKSSSSNVWLSLLLAFSLPCGLAVAAKQQEDEQAACEAAEPTAAAATAAAAATPAAVEGATGAEDLAQRCPSLTSTSADSSTLSSCYSSSDDLGAAAPKYPAAAAAPEAAAAAGVACSGKEKAETSSAASARVRPRGKGAMRQLTYKTASINLSGWQLIAAAAGAAAPVVYGQFVSNQWSVGLCVFGGLRWALELQAAHHLRLTA
ncbi:GNS1/SUR4 family domain-containing protein, putative [Eimeria brunetti]|uniref:Elongation of fatty acids protein n=1 Tax=Eimeria brunetti TaxID=51314 RepID=U6LII1_9EIME|nr:GNS1/SUR4 family domain-containing protein, putative [Eimeria brunetti]